MTTTTTEAAEVAVEAPTATWTPEQELTVVRLLDTDNGVEFTAVAAGLDEPTVHAIGAKYGYPDAFDGAVELTPLLADAQVSTSTRTRNLGRKVAERAVQLRDRLAAEQATAQARAEVEQLESQLAAAKARIRGVHAGATSGQKARVGEHGVDNAAVRQWARDNDITVNARGRIPRDVVEAWRAATS